MAVKIIGAILIVAGCGGVGFKIAANYRHDERTLEQIVGILDFMQCELQYRLTPLPALCREIASHFGNMPGQLFMELAQEIEAQVSANIGQCMKSVLSAQRTIPAIIHEQLLHLGTTLGQFDLDGQLKGLEAVRQDCARILDGMRTNREERLRSYQTLGLCAGAALAILFI